LLAGCAVSSAALLITAAIGLFSETSKQEVETGAKLVSEHTLKNAAKRAISVLLPFLAVFELGGSRTSIILLAGAAAGLLNISGASTFSSILKTITSKWIFLASIFFVAAIDLFLVGSVTGELQ